MVPRPGTCFAPVVQIKSTRGTKIRARRNKKVCAAFPDFFTYVLWATISRIARERLKIERSRNDRAEYTLSCCKVDLRPVPSLLLVSILRQITVKKVIYHAKECSITSMIQMSHSVMPKALSRSRNFNNKMQSAATKQFFMRERERDRSCNRELWGAILRSANKFSCVIFLLKFGFAVNRACGSGDVVRTHF